MEIPKDVLESIRLDPAMCRPDFHTARREARILEAANWPSGESQDARKYQTIWSGVGYEVRLGKPGKEVAREKRTNAYDMHPAVATAGRRIDQNASFRDIFASLAHLQESRSHLLVLGCLLFRSAYMADHFQDGKGMWRYAPPRPAVSYLAAHTSSIYNLPPEVFLHYIDAIAWNEDVKYYFRDKAKYFRRGIGRVTNLTTCVNLVTVLFGEKHWIDFAYELTFGGVAPLMGPKAIQFFTQHGVPSTGGLA